MNQDLVKKYLELYSSGKYKQAISDHYSDDAVFEVAGVEYVGKANIISFIEERRRTTAEILKPIHIFSGNSQVAVELSVELHALQDDPTFNIKPIKQGEIINMRIAAFYEIKDGKIHHVRVYR